MWLKGVVPTNWREDQGPMPISVEAMLDDGTPDPAHPSGPFSVSMGGPAMVSRPRQLYSASMQPLPSLIGNLVGGKWSGFADPQQIKVNPPPLTTAPYVQVMFGLTLVNDLSYGGATNMCLWTPVSIMTPPADQVSVRVVNKDGSTSLAWSMAVAPGSPTQAIYLMRNGQQAGGTFFF